VFNGVIVTIKRGGICGRKMKIKFLKAPASLEGNIPKDLEQQAQNHFDNKKKIALYCAVQFMPYFKEVKSRLENSGIEVITSQPFRTSQEGQLLGCDSYNDSLGIDLDSIDGFVYIGDGDFHPHALLFAQEGSSDLKPILIIGVKEGRLRVLTQDNIEKYLKKRKANFTKFYVSSNIGVFITTKWGQEYRNSALKLKELYPEKNFYYFIGDNFSDSELENFPHIECWINTACPRIGQDDITRISKPLLNIKDIWK